MEYQENDEVLRLAQSARCDLIAALSLSCVSWRRLSVQWIDSKWVSLCLKLVLIAAIAIETAQFASKLKAWSWSSWGVCDRLSTKISYVPELITE
ncbi:MAG: hypothetical protein ACKERG_01030 [Candidatus Hodgkinia cicadicola]